MERHPFDPISFFFGAVFVVVAAWVGLADSPLWQFEARWLWPGALIGLGVLLFGSVIARLGEGGATRDDDHGGGP